ncbi:MAG: UDP-3-O-[3-hydroxymyristoyl] N-acetylglucosamine deacetylase [Candidatus Eremiobacteraeota bacterium]|nr:UDP-3-O-[3-hydroxymyristoyl] N-acetylglucosamine deacetylase [Candidatus Eremiobacteraeota bacterium]
MKDGQQTLRDRLEFEGVGLHTGRATRAVVEPAGPGTGLVFRLERGLEFPATAEHVVDTQRATVLGAQGSTVSTVEHLLSALRGMGVDNALIVVEGGEVPVMDGSAKVFADAIFDAGVVAFGEPRAVFRPEHAMGFRDNEKTLAIIPAPEWRIKFTVDYPPPIGTQYFEGAITPELYRGEIAPARTFGYVHEVEALRARGLAQGGTLENALVFAPDGPMQALRWPNEPVRHKVLDMIGDFALLGMYPQCEAVALKSGHKLHAAVMAELRAEQRARERHSHDAKARD